jgi:hypothetical protein
VGNNGMITHRFDDGPAELEYDGRVDKEAQVDAHRIVRLADLHQLLHQRHARTHRMAHLPC